MKNVLEYIENSAKKFPAKTAFADAETSLSYSELENISKKVGTYLSKNLGTKNRPIAVIMDKTPLSLTAFFGVAYSGNFYIVMDCFMPDDRMNKIFDTLKPAAVIAEDKYMEKAEHLVFEGKLFRYEDAAREEINNELLEKIRHNMIDTDPLYALFTSGSTGVPKGAVICHRSVMAYADWVSETFDITEKTIFGNQTPFYFSMSVLDIFSTIRNGAELNIIPKEDFSFPIKLMEFLNERKVNTIYWVPSAMCIVANYKLFEYIKVPLLKKVLFAGEVMPVRQLKYWIKALENDVLFANLYGPTEVTDICSYYVVDRELSDDESLPIGKSCNNCDVMVVKDDNTEAAVGEEGELLVRGSFLAMGYYANEEKTAAAFVQNPLNPYYPEIVYRTGDLVKYNEKGELIYISRKDFQIKHMGYRIELGEIETAVNSLERITASACIYDEKDDNIVVVYQGKKLTDTDIIDGIKEKVPPYMLPNVLVKIKDMPHNSNGKIDRKWLKNNYKNI